MQRDNGNSFLNCCNQQPTWFHAQLWLVHLNLSARGHHDFPPAGNVHFVANPPLGLPSIVSNSQSQLCVHLKFLRFTSDMFKYVFPRKNESRELKQTTTVWQRQRRQTKGLMSRTIAVRVHVRYWSLCILLPFSAKQQREMTKFCVFSRT